MRIAKACDSGVKRLLEGTITDPANPNYGGFFNKAEGMVIPGSSIGCMVSYVSSFYNEDSEYYKSPALMDSMNLALDFTKKIQREDGTFDLLISNFHSAPDTGFIMHGMGRLPMQKISNK